MSRTSTEVQEDAVIVQPEYMAPLPPDDLSTATSPRQKSSLRERKREQNRIAQRNYRRNQKQKLEALKAVVGETTGAILSSSTTPCTCRSRDSLPRDGCEDSMWNFEPLIINESPPSTVLPSLGRTALHRAVTSGNEAIVRLLLEQGADVVKQDGYGQTALHLAVENGYENVVRALLDKMPDPNLTDSMGRTALFSAIQTENEAVAKLLLEAEVDVNWRDSLGDVALHVAAERGSEALTLLLLTHGANIDA